MRIVDLAYIQSDKLVQVYDRLGEMTDEKSKKFLLHLFEVVQKYAYHIAQNDNNQKSVEHYWNSAKAYIAARILDGKIIVNLGDYYECNFSQKPRALEILLDAIEFGRRGSGCSFQQDWYNDLRTRHFSDLGLPKEQVAAI